MKILLKDAVKTELKIICEEYKKTESEVVESLISTFYEVINCKKSNISEDEITENI